MFLINWVTHVFTSVNLFSPFFSHLLALFTEESKSPTGFITKVSRCCYFWLSLLNFAHGFCDLQVKNSDSIKCTAWRPCSEIYIKSLSQSAYFRVTKFNLNSIITLKKPIRGHLCPLVGFLPDVTSTLNPTVKSLKAFLIINILRKRFAP